MLKTPEYSLDVCTYILQFQNENLQFIKLQCIYIQTYVTQITCVVFPLISVLLLVYSRCDSLSCSEFCPFPMQKKYQEPSNEHFKQHRGGMTENDKINLSVAEQIPPMSRSPQRCSYDSWPFNY
jgi:hypothetical protein